MPNYVNKPKLIYWEITESCNHNCIHCSNYWRNFDNSKVSVSNPISANILMEVAHKIAEIKPSRVVITGGEPLIIFNILQSAVEFLLAQKIQVSINTNCAMLTDEIARYLAEKQIGLFVSFPSCVPAEFDKIVDRMGAFEQVSNGLKIAKINGVKFTTNTVVSRINIASLYGTIKYLKETYGLRFFSVTYASRPINANDEFSKIMLDEEERHYYLSESVRICRDLKVKIRAASHMALCSFKDYSTFKQFALRSACTAGKKAFTITGIGDLRACVRDDKTYGNILNESFDEILTRMSVWRKRKLYIPAECKFCPVKGFCNGGCPVDNKISPKAGQQINIHSVPERKWKTYIWTQSLIFRNEILGIIKGPAAFFKYIRTKLIK